MATEKKPFWQRHLRVLGALVLLFGCALFALIFLASPRLAAAAVDAGHFHPAFVFARVALYSILLLNWRRYALALNPSARSDTVAATRRSVITVFIIFEVLMGFPRFMALFGT